jgi:YVTN family beta-propeller protein
MDLSAHHRQWVDRSDKHESVARSSSLLVPFILVIILGVTSAWYSTGAISVTATPGAPTAGGSLTLSGTSSMELSPRDFLPPLITSIPVGQGPGSAAFDPVNDFVYVANYDSDSVSVINGTTVVTTILLSGPPDGVAVDSSNGEVYVVIQSERIQPPPAAYISIIQNSTVIASVSLGSFSDGFEAFDPTNGYLYVPQDGAPEQGLNVVDVIDGASIIARVPVGNVSAGIAFDSVNGYVYVANEASGNVSVINGTSTTGSIPAAGYNVGFNPVNGDIYLTDNDNLTVIHGMSIVASIILSTATHSSGLFEGLAFDSINGYGYVGNFAENEVSVVNGTSSTGVTISLGYSTYAFSDPVGVTFDLGTGDVYVTSFESNSVSVINGSFYYPSISSFSANPSTVEIDSTTVPSTTLTVRASGSGTLTYAYSGLPLGCSSSNGSTLACTPTVSGTYSVRVSANDSEGVSAVDTTILRVAAALVTHATATPNPADVGIPIQFASGLLGGTTPNTTAWEFGDGSSSTIQSPSHSYATAGDYIVRVWVNDSDGGSNSSAVPILIDPALKVTLSVSNSTPALGQSIEVDASASGGAGPYAYAYFGLPPGCDSIDNQTIGCLPTQAGLYKLMVIATDHNGISVNASISIQIIFDFTVVVPSQATVDQPFTLSVKPYGGYGTFTYSYTGLPPGCTSVNASQMTCTPSEIGNYNVSISVHDQVGDNATHMVKIAVVPENSPILESPLIRDGALLAAAITVAAIAIVLFVSRGKGQRSPPDLYAAYRAGPAGGPLIAEVTHQDRDTSATASAATEPESTCEDSYSDLV